MAKVAVAAWILSAASSLAPGWLLFTNAESRLAEGAGLALLVAGVFAATTGASMVRGASTWSLASAPVVVTLCLSALIALAVDGRVSPRGTALFGGAAAGAAVLAGALTRRAMRPARGG